jgi:predicted TIM-barrel fold metal-dependent hydrolase
MKPLLPCILAAVLLVSSTAAQTVPLVDHHQHLFSPGIAKLISATPEPPIELPAELAALLDARGRAAQDRGALVALYRPDAWLLQPAGGKWVKGRDALVDWWIGATRSPFRLTPVGLSRTAGSASIAAYLTEGTGDSARHVGHLMIAAVQDSGRWRIASEAFQEGGPVVINPILAKDVIRLLDEAGIRRAAILSTAYILASPNRKVENVDARVRAENDWTSHQVAEFPERLRGFCSVNPLRDSAVAEIERCARDPFLRRGLKLHIGNSQVDLHDSTHVVMLRRVFRAANDHGMAIVIHLRASIGRHLPYGRDEAKIFLEQVLPAAPDVPVQIAHLAGSQGYRDRDPAVDDALGVFAAAIEKHDPRVRNLWFDVTTVVDLSTGAEEAKLIARRIRQIGVGRVLYGSDAATGGNLPPRQAWAAFRQLPLTAEEFRTIANNVAPYMK